MVILYELQGLSYEEIADRLHCPLGTVKSRLFNARQELKIKLAQELSGYPSARSSIAIVQPPGPLMIAAAPGSVTAAERTPGSIAGENRTDVARVRPVCQHYQVYPAFAELHENLVVGACHEAERYELGLSNVCSGTGACRKCSERSLVQRKPGLYPDTPECGHYLGHHEGLTIDQWAGECPLKQGQVSYHEMMEGTGLCSKCQTRSINVSAFAEMRRRKFAKMIAGGM